MQESYRWPDGHSGGFAISVDVDGPIPHLWNSRGAGPRRSEIEQRTYGPRRGLARLLDLFESLGLRGSFYVPGAYAEAFPSNIEAVGNAGHELGLHGWMHEPPIDLSATEFRETVGRALELVSAFTRYPGGVVGYRSPSWDMTDDAFRILGELGLTYDSSMMGDDRPYLLGGLTEVPVSWVLDDAPFYRYVGGANPGFPPRDPDALAAQWSRELDAAAQFSTLAVITVHDWLSGRPAPAVALRDVLSHAQSLGLWCATVAEIAEWHVASGQAGERS
jgi:peptidoglycan/xylan/chitin deacetylase (PgdA/CDA1 family)